MFIIKSGSYFVYSDALYVPFQDLKSMWDYTIEIVDYDGVINNINFYEVSNLIWKSLPNFDLHILLQLNMVRLNNYRRMFHNGNTHYFSLYVPESQIDRIEDNRGKAIIKSHHTIQYMKDT